MSVELLIEHGLSGDAVTGLGMGMFRVLLQLAIVVKLEFRHEVPCA